MTYPFPSAGGNQERLIVSSNPLVACVLNSQVVPPPICQSTHEIHPCMSEVPPKGNDDENSQYQHIYPDKGEMSKGYLNQEQKEVQSLKSKEFEKVLEGEVINIYAGN